MIREEVVPSADEVKKPVKKKRRIPPPNPPFRLRKKGRYSMLRVSVFKHDLILVSYTPVKIH